MTEPENMTNDEEIENQALDSDNNSGDSTAAGSNPAENSAPELELHTGPEPGSIEELTQKLAESEKRTLIAHADLENYRKRARRDMQDQLKYAPMKLMMELLEAVDNLERAINAAEEDPSSSGLLDGVKMVATQLTTVLENHGCKQTPAVGAAFDANLHQAIQMQPSSEFEEGIVTLEARKGFQLHDRVLRPSQVFVSTGPAKDS